MWDTVTIGPVAWHEAGHSVTALALGAEVESVTVRAAGGHTAVLMTHLGAVERAAVTMAGAESEILFAGTAGFDAYGRSAVPDKRKLAALRLTVAEEVTAFDLARSVLRRNAEAVRALAAMLRSGVTLSESQILNAVAGRVVYFKQVVR